MSRRIVSGIILFLLLLGMSTFAVQLAKSSPATITVPDDYLTIQGAIDNADIGDTVFVRNGTYPESVIIDKRVSLLGENRETTIINASGFHDGIIVRSDNVMVKGFTILESDWNGIYVEGSGCSIIGNNLIRNHEAIFLDGRASIVRNITVCNSYIADSDDCGILIWNSQSNNITSNVVQNNCFGIYLYINASMNTIENNQVLSNEGSGIPIVTNSSDNIISNNNISGNGFRFSAWTCGIAIAIGSNRNTITFNAICDNRFGIRQHFHADNNRIHHNNFVNNTEHAINILPREPCINIWDNDYPSGGNYWSNYNGSDSSKGPYQNLTGSDGIGDSPYVIDDNNRDEYPLMEPYTHPLRDINYDGKVNMQDIAIVARAFGSYQGHPNWNPEADVNKDGKVDLKDIALVAKDFGK